jgi:hypothetical protein
LDGNNFSSALYLSYNITTRWMFTLNYFCSHKSNYQFIGRARTCFSSDHQRAVQYSTSQKVVIIVGHEDCKVKQKYIILCKYFEHWCVYSQVSKNLCSIGSSSEYSWTPKEEVRGTLHENKNTWKEVYNFKLILITIIIIIILIIIFNTITCHVITLNYIVTFLLQTMSSFFYGNGLGSSILRCVRI